MFPNDPVTNPLSDEIIIERALNAACKSIQDDLGITTGDVAANFFSGTARDRFDEIFSRYIYCERAMNDDDPPDDAGY